ncbi:hypothetical protein GH714_034972 [Hevea brasiliensis]|uniref:SET domain-containing protein n=1 Tax=Hevea brasiliensis TaxID=3981 RepID=A0A6A6L4I3_HEVBR|nr:hypothetical protein GH714_034972 [Hevea brasiliensis]
MPPRAGTTQPWWSLGQLFFTISRRFSARLNFSFLSEAKVLSKLTPILSLFASKDILTGDCILRVPYSVQIASDNLLPKVSALLDDQVGSVMKVAIVLLVEQKLGWALKQFPHILRSITFKDFMHAYALVKSRAWGSTKGVSLIPFADFLNHDGVSEAIVLNDEDKLVSEVIADRNYAAHEEVKIQIDIPHHDFLREMKLEILQKHYLPTIEDDNGFKSSWDSFIIKEVKSAEGKGKGLPQSLRAFARVLCCTSHQVVGAADSPNTCKRFALQRQMALDLLTGELRILKSASAWLKNYCASLLQHADMNDAASYDGSVQE